MSILHRACTRLIKVNVRLTLAEEALSLDNKVISDLELRVVRSPRRSRVRKPRFLCDVCFRGCKSFSLLCLLARVHAPPDARSKFSPSDFAAALKAAPARVPARKRERALRRTKFGWQELPAFCRLDSKKPNKLTASPDKT